MNKYTLKEFVNLCNGFTCQIANKKPDDANDEAYKLGKDFEKLYTAYENNEDIEKVIVKEESNKEFFKCLLARKDAQGNLITNKYTFLQDTNIEAKVNVFKPFENGILSQKWHVFISLLAFLDTANFNHNYKLPNTFKVKGKINNIMVDKEKNEFSIEWIKNGKLATAPYPSQSMKQWIFGATENKSSKS